MEGRREELLTLRGDVWWSKIDAGTAPRLTTSLRLPTPDVNGPEPPAPLPWVRPLDGAPMEIRLVLTGNIGISTKRLPETPSCRVEDSG